MIFDVDPKQFLVNINGFVAEVKQVDYLNLFINSLNNDERGSELEFMRPRKEEDIIEKQHRDLMLQFSTSSALRDSKVNLICDALRSQLHAVNKNNCFMLPILTTYIKKEPQELKQVLALIQLMQRDEHG